MKGHDLQGTKILIVDDSPTNLEILSNYLARAGYEIFVKKDGIRALESLEKNHPDIILLDIVMPEIDGFETCRRLKENDVTKDIPIIFMTALSETQDKIKGFKLGAVDYITKPFQKEEVLERVNTHLTIQRLQKELRQKNTELQNALERERKMTSDLRLSLSLALPHELRTPLTAILGFSSFLTKQEKLPEPAQIAQYGNSIYRSSLRLHRLVENTLIYANLKLLKYTARVKTLVQSDTTSNITRMIYSLALPKASEARRERDLVIQVENAAVQVSPTHFEKILTEVLDNAFKNSATGTPVEIKASVNNSLWSLSISDKGCGMSEEQIATVGAFMQFDREKREQQGLGLGLTIAHLLTQLEGGMLSIESELRQGTTVSMVFNCDNASAFHTAEQEKCWIEIPLPDRPMFRSAHDAPEREIQGYITSHGVSSSDLSGDANIPPYTILSIDQSWVNGEALGQLLVPLGFTLIEAFDEFDGVNKIVTHSPNIILWDASRTKQQAFELVRQIRRSVSKAPARIVVLTDKDHDEESLRKLENCCDDIWQKPVAVQTVFERLARLLQLQWVYK
ncbi:MAG: response regulator [bacterium]|nr:response regulator [bacterium]